MAGEPPNGLQGEEGSSSRELSFLDQFLRRLESDQAEATVSTSGVPVAAAQLASGPYASLPLPANPTNPWQFMSPQLDPSYALSPAGLQIGHHPYRPPVPSSYLNRDPLADFPWMLAEFDPQRGSLQQVQGDQGGDSRSTLLGTHPAFHDTGQRSTMTQYLPPLPYDDDHLAAGAGFSSTLAQENLLTAGGYGVPGGHRSRPAAESSLGVQRGDFQGGSSTPRYRKTDSLIMRPDESATGRGKVVQREAFRGGDQELGGSRGRVGAPQGGEGLTYARYGSSARLDPVQGSQPSFDAVPVPRFERNVTPGVHGTHDARVRWVERSMPSTPGAHVVQSSSSPQSTTQFGGVLQSVVPARPASRGPAPAGSPLVPGEGVIAATAGGSTNESAGTPNTSLSSGGSLSDGDDDESGDKKEPPAAAGRGEGASSGKRKTPEPSAEEAGDESVVKSEASDLKKPATINRPRKRGGATRLREPRVAIKTRTDVDIMDDGFKWRKYGQKAVKNSPHPRNYYRCTTPQCPVRKRVERSNEDSGLVITTYEGTHTHETPGFRRSAAAGYFGDRGLYLNPGGGRGPFGPAGFGPGSTLLPLPPGFTLTSLQPPPSPSPSSPQQQVRPRLAGQEQLLPGSFQRDQSLLRAQQFLGLEDPSAEIGPGVKQEPGFQFASVQDFIPRGSAAAAAPFTVHPDSRIAGGHEPESGSSGAVGSQFLERMHLSTRARLGPPPPPLLGSSSPFRTLDFRPTPPHQMATNLRSSPPADHTRSRLHESGSSDLVSSGIDEPRSDQTFIGGAGPRDFVGREEEGLIPRQELQGLDQMRARQRALQQSRARGHGSSEPDSADEGLLQDIVRPAGLGPGSHLSR